MSGSARLTCVGTGIRLAGHVSKLSESLIRSADIVYCLMPDTLQENWLRGINPNTHSLQPFYAVGKSRAQTYQEMIDLVLSKLDDGLDVCLCTYGHPGVFALVTHSAMDQARQLGHEVHMEPGISAEDCLFADLGIDPGRSGCQQYEASQFMFYRHSVNPAAVLILWQIAIAGEHTLTRFDTTEANLAILVDQLSEWYPADHEVILYEGVFLPISTPRMDRIRLDELPTAALKTYTTLVIPPVAALEPNTTILERLGLTAADLKKPDR